MVRYLLLSLMAMGVLLSCSPDKAEKDALDSARLTREESDDSQSRWRFREIKTEQLHAMMQAKEPFLLVDSLPPIFFQVDHLPGAVNIPINKLSAATLPVDKGKKIVFYGLFNESYFPKINAENAIDLGHTEVFVYEQGIREWKKRLLPLEKGTLSLPNRTNFNVITPAELVSSRSNFTVIDILGLESKLGKINGAITVEMIHFLTDYTKIPRNKKVVLYSLKARIERLAILFLISKGYRAENLHYLKGGLMYWIKSGYPVDNTKGTKP